MKYRIVEENNEFIPQYKKFLFWHHVPEITYDNSLIIKKKHDNEITCRTAINEFKSRIKYKGYLIYHRYGSWIIFNKFDHYAFPFLDMAKDCIDCKSKRKKIIYIYD